MEACSFVVLPISSSTSEDSPSLVEASVGVKRATVRARVPELEGANEFWHSWQTAVVKGVARTSS
jgi:hypothetical protein